MLIVVPGVLSVLRVRSGVPDVMLTVTASSNTIFRLIVVPDGIGSVSSSSEVISLTVGGVSSTVRVIALLPPIRWFPAISVVIERNVIKSPSV